MPDQHRPSLKRQKVSIALKETGDAVNATITDDGHGFDYDTLLKNPGQERGLGLAGMHERAVLLDGTLNILTASGKGTTVKVSIPLAYARRSAMPEKEELTIQ